MSERYFLCRGAGLPLASILAPTAAPTAPALSEGERTRVAHMSGSMDGWQRPDPVKTTR
ncbi:hypothetical protein ACFORG_02180 [Lutimaribacter marinistellae]|uniref:Uncharacterized protein n=1 Tax=Lutimaribacter marinistellae TaxID=1820329 RepID=A0ABV7TBK1_9RHOB